MATPERAGSSLREQPVPAYQSFVRDDQPAVRRVDRIRGLDAGRGAAMLFACLSHFSVNFFAQSEQGIRSTLWHVGMVASPTFMLISGIITGLLFEIRRDQFPKLTRTLAGRGLFMLTIGHALILLTFIPHYASVRTALMRGFITDVIAVAILIGPALVTRLGIRQRLYLSGGLITGAWLLATAWPHATGLLSAIRYVLLGPGQGWFSLNFPLLPWLAVYFAGTAVGGWFGTQREAQTQIFIERRLLALGMLAIGFSLAVKLSYEVVTAMLPALLVIDTLSMITSPFQKYPPSPIYAMFYGGIGLFITGALLWFDRRGKNWLVDWLSMLGRASLFVFMLQFFVYNVVVAYVPVRVWWPAHFAITLALISVSAGLWEKWGGNHVFNVLDWWPRRTGSFTSAARERARATD